MKGSLIVNFIRQEAGTAPDGKEIAVPYYTMSYDFLLEPHNRK
ncbi:MAG: hypothetical protein AB7O50_10800 [Pseudolabrys sp.]